MFSSLMKFHSILRVMLHFLYITPRRLTLIFSALVIASTAGSQTNGVKNPIVQIDASLGTFSIELLTTTTPVTVANFLNYVRDGDYDGSFVHRMVPGFVVQGGGYKLVDGVAITVPADPPIVNEFSVSNTRGTVAMAKLSGDPNSATSQWFINLSDNSSNLDSQNGGFTVFGKVIGRGMEVVDAIAALPTGTFAPPFSEAPTINGNLVFLNKVSLVQNSLETTGSATPASVAPGASTLITVAVIPGTNPPSTSIAVTVDLSVIGGSSAQALFDDGTNGDATNGDNVFSVRATVPSGTAQAGLFLAASASDGQSRRGTTSISLQVVTGQTFKVVNRGGISFRSKGNSSKTVTGYGRIQADEGMTTPAGLAIFGFTQNGTLVSEAGVPASVAANQGRIFAEINGSVTTGLAMANPNDGVANISFFFTGTDGVNFGAGSLKLGPNKQTAKFLNEHPFNGISPLIGTFTFISDVPVSVIALRGLTNERSEFLITTLPVTPLMKNTVETLYFPHFADGAGWTTQVILVNPTDATITGTVQFLGPGTGTTQAKPVELQLDDNRLGSEFPYAILPRTSIRLRTSNPAGTTQIGSIRVNRDAGSSAPSGVAVFSLQNSSVTVTEAGVPVSKKGSAFRLYVEADGQMVRSGMAITNTSNTATVVSFELTNLDGSATALTKSIMVPPLGHIAKFIDEIFSSLTTPFAGILRINSASTEIAVVGLRSRTNQRGDFLITTTPPASEIEATNSANLFFPHFADSGGWTTQFILFSGTAGQSSQGSLRFTDQQGGAIDLILNQ